MKRIFKKSLNQLQRLDISTRENAQTMIVSSTCIPIMIEIIENTGELDFNKIQMEGFI